MTVVAVVREGLDADAGRPESAAQRMQQRLEWEREFLEAAPRQPERETDTRTMPESEADRGTVDGEVSQPTAPGATSDAEAPPRGSRASAEIGPEVAAREAAQPIGEAPNGAADVEPQLGVASARHDTEPSSLSALRTDAGQQRAEPPPTALEPDSFGFVNDEGAVRIWIRDNGVSRSAGLQLVDRIRTLLSRIGLRLSGFTLNGKKLFTEEGSGIGIGDRSDGDSERELDLFL